MARRVLHLTGSPTSPFWADLSRLYASDCLAVTRDLPGIETTIAWVSPDGSWRFPADLDPATIEAAPAMTLAGAVARIAAERIDVMVPQLFCRAGMTAYRALFDVLTIPYVGNTAEAMAIGADKALARAIVAAAGVRVPDGEVVEADGRPTMAPPVVVKPVDADNSTGVSLVSHAAELPRAIDEARRHGPRVLVERFVPLGREVRCGVLDLGDGPVALPIEEYRLDPRAGIRTFADKISEVEPGALRLQAKGEEHAWIVPTSDPAVEAVQTTALRCHRALGCRDYGLFDFRIDPDGQPWFIEAGLYCSFAEQSVVSTMARAAGWTTADLFRACVETAAGRAGAAPAARDAAHPPRDGIESTT
ncbi:MAG: hypothetical protein Q7T55_04360 [Solirubrobacteraceae bacterium]|nr:hypothetical protein [Solirubrobacteraceae bacterium]